MLLCTFRNVSCTASSASTVLPNTLRARFFMRAPCIAYKRSYPRRSPAWHAAARAASSLAAATAAPDGPPIRCSEEGSTRVPHLPAAADSRGAEGIVAFHGSASPIVPIPGSCEIDDTTALNVRGLPPRPIRAAIDRTTALQSTNSALLFRLEGGS